MKFPQFISGSYESKAFTADCERTVNWYPELLESQGATARTVLMPTPGVELLSASAGSSFAGRGGGFLGRGEANANARAHFCMNGREFAVIGEAFYEVNDIGGRKTLFGYVGTDGRPATICSNGDGGGELFVTSAGNGFILDLATETLTQITALDGKATMGDMLDGYFLCFDAATSTFYCSELFDGLTWNTGTQFGQRSLQPDRWSAMKVSGRYIWFLGEFTSEVWYDTGATFPFAPHPSGGMNYGIAAPWSVCLMGDDVVWLAMTRSGRTCVVRASGFTPTVISSYPLETTLQGYDTVADAIGDAYSERGHSFYVLHCDRQGISWVWDAETQMWHERGTWISAENRYTCWRPRYCVVAFGQHRMLDVSGTGVLHLSSDFTLDADGLLIRRLRRAPALNQENQEVFYSSFELDLDAGLGLTGTAQGSNPRVMLRLSNDGGRTWISEQWCSAGKIGEYSHRARWNRLGAGRKRVFEVSVTDPIPWRLTGAYLEASNG